MGMPNRARNSRSSFSFIFFCWWVTFLPSPPSPSPYPLTVFARINRRAPPVVDRRLERGVHLLRIMTAAPEFPDLVVGQVIHHLEQFRVFAEEVLSRIASRFHRILLKVAIDRFLHPFEQPAVMIRGPAMDPSRHPRSL